MRNAKRVALVASAVVLGGLVGPVPVVAAGTSLTPVAEAAAASPGPVKAHHGSVKLSFESVLDPKTGQLTDRPLGSVHTEYDAVGKVLRETRIDGPGQPEVLRPLRSEPAVAPTESSCYIRPTNDKNIFVYKPARIVSRDTSLFDGSFLLHRYDVLKARRTSEGLTTAFELCTVGSWRGKGGRSLTTNFVGLTAITDPRNIDLLVDSKPGIRQNSAVLSSVNIGATWGVVNVGASVPAVTTGVYTGSFGEYVGEIMKDNDFAGNPLNNVNAWWHNNDAAAPGTKDPVGETSNAVYEISPKTNFKSIKFKWGGTIWYRN